MSRPFFSEFLDDYFAECDEHLISIRQHLLMLGSAEGNVVDGAVLEELLRNYHSLKGLSAMVGFEELSAISHATEEYLRHLKEGATLSQDGLEAMIAAANGVEAALAARRENQSIDLSHVAGRFATLVDHKAVPPPEIAAKAPKSKVWRLSFRPSAELSARGIDVNSIRARLRDVGTITHATPAISPTGHVTFEFHLAATEREKLDELLNAGMLELLGAEDTPAEAEEQSSHDALPQTVGSTNIVRVDMARLDELMRLVGELVISRSRLDEALRVLTPANVSGQMRALQEINGTIERQIRDLRESVMQVRMVPIRQVFERMRFLVRSLEREGQKVIVETSGDDTEIDKLVVERMMDPLLHLVRNAISHGLENPEERLAAGKPAHGALHLRAFTSADTVIIEIEDDGRGIDESAVQARAEASGLARRGEKLDEAGLLNILCHPGFSTRNTARLAEWTRHRDGCGEALSRRT